MLVSTIFKLIATVLKRIGTSIFKSRVIGYDLHPEEYILFLFYYHTQTYFNYFIKNKIGLKSEKCLC